jgi:hypothetical protein
LKLLLSLVVHVLKVKSMDVARDISQDGQQDVNAEVDPTARNQEDTEGGDEKLPVGGGENGNTVMITTRIADAPAIVVAVMVVMGGVGGVGCFICGCPAHSCLLAFK